MRTLSLLLLLAVVGVGSGCERSEPPPTPATSEATAAADPAKAEGTDQKARAHFLEVERFARLPAEQQLKGLGAFYREVAPLHMNQPRGMMIMSYIPADILDRGNRTFRGGNINDGWAAQLKEAASTLTPDEVADKLGSRVWLEEGAYIRARQALKQHPEALRALVKKDLEATDAASFERGCAVAGQLDMKEFSGKLVTVYLADTALSEAAGMALQFLRDPAIVGPLVADIEKAPKHVVRHYTLLQGTQWHRPANPALVKLLDSPDAEIRCYAAYAIYECQDAALARPLAKLAQDSDSRLVVAALYMAGHLDNAAFAGVRGAFTPLISSGDLTLKVGAIECFAKHKHMEAGPAILAMLKLEQLEPGPAVTVIQSLHALTGDMFGYDMHQWGPERNAAAIAKYEGWLRRHS